MRDVRCSRGRKKCTNTVVSSSSTWTPPGKSHFLRSTRKRPADVDVLLPSPLLLMLWHFSDLTADLLNVFWLCMSACLSVPDSVPTVSSRSRRGRLSWIYQNKLFVPRSLPKCFNSRLCSPPGTSLSPPGSPSLSQNSRSRRASVGPAMSHIWRRIITLEVSAVTWGLITGQGQLKYRIQYSLSYL